MYQSKIGPNQIEAKPQQNRFFASIGIIVGKLMQKIRPKKIDTNVVITRKQDHEIIGDIVRMQNSGKTPREVALQLWNYNVLHRSHIAIYMRQTGYSIDLIADALFHCPRRDLRPVERKDIDHALRAAKFTPQERNANLDKLFGMQVRVHGLKPAQAAR